MMPDRDAWLVEQFTPEELLDACCPPDSTPAPLVPLRPISALQQWQREVGAGFRGQHPNRPSMWHDDALFRAACLEAAGLEAQRAGLARTAAMLFGRSAEIVLTAAGRAA